MDTTEIDVIYTTFPFAECPNCDYDFYIGNSDWESSTCPNCGQKLKWRKE